MPHANYTSTSFHAEFSNWLENNPSIGEGPIQVKKTRGRKAPLAAALDKPLVPPPGFTFGCDPEGFLFLKDSGTPISAAGVIPGDKRDPYRVDKGAIQVDGMAVEFNIDPASTHEEWEDNITTVIAKLEARLPDNVEIRWIPSVEFPADVFDDAPDSAKELGCKPDFNAWDGGTNPTPNPENPYVRCAGGHLHFGLPKEHHTEDLSDLQHLMNCQDLGKQADWFLGGWSAYHDEDTVRRELYGKMGAIRYKPYGVEYRVLSNFWVPDKELRRAVWDRMVYTVQSISTFCMYERTSKTLTSLLKRAINQRDIANELSEVCVFPLQTLDHSRSII